MALWQESSGLLIGAILIIFVIALGFYILEIYESLSEKLKKKK